MKTRKQQTDDYKNYTLKESETVRFPDDEEAAWVLDTLSYMGIKDESEGTIFIAPIVYTFYDADKHPIYVGKSINIKERFDWHRRQKYWSEVSYIGILLCDNLVWMDIVEICEINNKMPKYNRDSNYDSAVNKYVCFCSSGLKVRVSVIDGAELVFKKKVLDSNL